MKEKYLEFIGKNKNFKRALTSIAYTKKHYELLFFIAQQDENNSIELYPSVMAMITGQFDSDSYYAECSREPHESNEHISYLLYIGIDPTEYYKMYNEYMAIAKTIGNEIMQGWIGGLVIGDNNV